MAKRGGTALSTVCAPPDVVSGDVYDLANLVLGEIAFLHALTPDAVPITPKPVIGHRMPSHVFRIASTLDAQLAAIADR